VTAARNLMREAVKSISGQTLRARIWSGLVDADAAGHTLAGHEAVYRALESRDGPLAQAAARP
jgi:GntR family transcriptional regulator, transcriptional repressor for pyruvate dehydrogenase complex